MDTRKGGHELNVMHHLLGMTVVLLVVGLSGVCTPVKLKVKLTIPCRKLGAFLGSLLELDKEIIHRISHFEAGESTISISYTTTPSKLLEMLPCGSASSVSFPKDEEGARILIHGFVLRHTTPDITKVGVGRVRLARSHVAEDLTSVEGDPVESGVGEIIDVVPAQLLREESAHPSHSAKLRQLCGIPKGVWEPEGCAALSKMTLEEPLSIHKCPNERFTSGDVRVMLNPATADGVELPLLDFLFNPIESCRIVHLEPLVLLR